MDESKLILYEILINNKKIKLSKPLTLNMMVEKGKVSDTYILEHEELGLFAIQKTLDRAKIQVQGQIAELWKLYIDCPEGELGTGGKRFKKKLLKYLSEASEDKSPENKGDTHSKEDDIEDTEKGTNKWKINLDSTKVEKNG
jgi:hypothetical protein